MGFPRVALGIASKRVCVCVCCFFVGGGILSVTCALLERFAGVWGDK